MVILRFLRHLLLFPLALTEVVLGVMFWDQARRAAWPTAQGTVVKSERHWHVVTPSNGKGYPIADIRYRYEVDGRTYDSNRYDIDGPYGGPVFGSERGIRDLLRRYPVGASVRVYFWPSDASFAVLEPRMSLAEWLWAAVGTLLIGLVLRFNWAEFRAGWRPWRWKRDPDRFRANLGLPPRSRPPPLPR